MSQEWISESEASELSGVAANSLQRFAKAGYLQFKEDSGKSLFVKEDIERIFGLSTPFSIQLNEKEQNGSSNPHQPQSLKDRIELLKTSHTVPHAIPLGEKAPIFKKSFKSSSVALSPEEDSLKKRFSRLTRHLAKLTRTVQSQKQSLDLRNSRIKDLKERRDWLRSQVEKLEAKGDRDQLLLLSETQAISRLLTPKQIKSPVRLALEWLGVSSESIEEEKSETIEL